MSGDGKTHTLWAPLSGSILEVNAELVSDPALAVRDPYGEGWLLKLDPRNLEEELKGLELK